MVGPGLIKHPLALLSLQIPSSLMGRDTLTLRHKVDSCPNAQLAGYLFEWYEQAAMRNDRLQFVYRRVLMMCSTLLKLTVIGLDFIVRVSNGGDGF